MHKDPFVVDNNGFLSQVEWDNLSLEETSLLLAKAAFEMRTKSDAAALVKYLKKADGVYENYKATKKSYMIIKDRLELRETSVEPKGPKAYRSLPGSLPNYLRSSLHTRIEEAQFSDVPRDPQIQKVLDGLIDWTKLSEDEISLLLATTAFYANNSLEIKKLIRSISEVNMTRGPSQVSRRALKILRDRMLGSPVSISGNPPCVSRYLDNLSFASYIMAALDAQIRGSSFIDAHLKSEDNQLVLMAAKLHPGRVGKFIDKLSKTYKASGDYSEMRFMMPILSDYIFRKRNEIPNVDQVKQSLLILWEEIPTGVVKSNLQTHTPKLIIDDMNINL